MNLPSKLSETGFGAKEKRKINEIIDYLKSITPRDTTTVTHDRTATGIFPKAKGGGSVSGTGAVYLD
jgi:hypothetical protein